MKKKMLIVIQLVRRGGVELAAINFARNINKSKFDITFLLVDTNENQDEELLNELKESGYKFIAMPSEADNYIKKYRFMNELFKTEHFDIVHSHVIFFSAFVLRAAYKNEVKIRIAHSHISKWNRKENFAYRVYKFITRRMLNKYSTHILACSTAAGEFLYGKQAYKEKGIFLANGVKPDNYSYNENKRRSIRNEFNVGDGEILIGHIGAVYRIKNQQFLVKFLNEFLKTYENAKLIMVGEIFDKDPVDKLIKEYHLEDKVIFAGSRNDVSSFDSAFDLMVFPSLHEALPLALIEAQMSSLPCLISDSVTDEVRYNSNVEFASLDENLSVWVSKAEKLLKIPRLSVNLSHLIESYDINSVSKQLQKLYLE